VMSRSGIIQSDDGNRDLENTGRRCSLVREFQKARLQKFTVLQRRSDCNSRFPYLTEVRLTGLGCFPY
jgi:hypothetical protein